MSEFSDIVYRGYGPHQRKGGGFSTLGVRSQEAMDAALADGWYRTLPEAIEAHDNPKAALVEYSNGDVTITELPEPDDNAPPTRAEIEAKCAELGIKVHHRHSDASLLAKIEEASRVI